MITKKELTHYLSRFQRELDQILGYWLKFSPERSGEGFYPAVNLQNQPVLTAHKSCVLNARILWTFSAAYMHRPAKELGQMARRAYHVVTNHFRDPELGGYYMELDAENQVVNNIKHTYAQAFVLYALCKYHESDPSGGIVHEIRDYFSFLEEKTKDPERPGYLEAFTREWQVLGSNRMADGDEPRSMNTHLHILEAYAALYRVWQGDLVRERLTELIRLFMDRIIREDGHLGIFFDESFTETAESRSFCSFGHDIEASWLLWEAAEILGDKGILSEIKPLVIRMTGAVLRSGVDRSGGLFLESMRFGSHIRTNKHWWPQAETLVGFMNAFQLTGEKKYWDVVKETWEFIDRHVIDHEGGEWFTKVNRLGIPFLEEPVDDPSPYYRNDWKIDPWKSPYHNGRAMMELVRRIGKVQGSRTA